MTKVRTVSDIVRWRLCLGCGACAYICPDKVIELADAPDEGIRPVVRRTDCGDCRVCLEVCPAHENDHTPLSTRPGVIPELLPSVGPVLEIWEGHAADEQIRFLGSSGGALTALALYCLERRAMHGVLHIGADPDQPLRNVTRLSRTRQELLEKTGSRYAPASACDRLDLIEQAPGPCVFIGQPSEVTALRKAQRLRPALDRNVGLALSFFCAGSPATRGTLELLKKLGVEHAEVGALRYRGNGWPGNFAVTLRTEVDAATGARERRVPTRQQSPETIAGPANPEIGASPSPHRGTSGHLERPPHLSEPSALPSQRPIPLPFGGGEGAPARKAYPPAWKPYGQAAGLESARRAGEGEAQPNPPPSTLNSLSPTGGEGRGEGASQSKDAPHTSEAAGLATPEAAPQGAPGASPSRSLRLTYKESWSFLQAYRPYSTRLCPDGTGEDADISCGDPWYREVHEGEPGSSLVVVRTELGRDIVRGAIAAGYVVLTPAEPHKLLASQKNLINKRAALWGRLLAFKLFGLPTPRLRGFSLFTLWLGLPLNDKLRSTLGTARRILTRKYYRPLKVGLGRQAPPCRP